MKSLATKKEENINLEIANFVFLCPKCHCLNPKIISISIKNCDLSNTIPSFRNVIEEPKITIQCQCSDGESTYSLFNFIKKIITPASKDFIHCDNTTRYHDDKKEGRLYCIFCKRWLCEECLESHEEDEEDYVSYHLYLNYEDATMSERLEKSWNELTTREKKKRKAEINAIMEQKRQIKNPGEGIKQLFNSINDIHEDMETFLLSKLKYNNKNYEEAEKNIINNYFEVNQVNKYLYFLYSMVAYNFEFNKPYWKQKTVVENYFNILYNYRFYSYSQTLKNNEKIINCLEMLQNDINYIKPTVEKRYIKWLHVEFEEKKFETLKKANPYIPFQPPF